MNKQTLEKINYNELITLAMTEPGTLSKSFSLFHDYSLLNTMYIVRQLVRRHLPIEPIKGYKAWHELNRQVLPNLLTGKSKYGFKNGIEVLHPVFGYFVDKDEHGNPKKDSKGNEIKIPYVKNFLYYSWHFSASQTELIDKSKSETIIENKFNIDLTKLCKALDIEIIPYNNLNGNIQGYALTNKKQLAINPVSDEPIETAIHEIAHILLQHNEVKFSRAVKEAEAEITTYIVLHLINNKVNLSNSRGYIQNWLKQNKIYNSDDLKRDNMDTNRYFTEVNSQRVINVANKILATLKPKKQYSKYNK